MANADIIALGEPLVEMVRLPDQEAGKTLYQQGVGGDTLTAVAQAARQGARVGYLSAVGDNPLGDAILDWCEAANVDTTHILRRPGYPTGLNVIDPDPIQRRFTYARTGSAASAYCADDVPEAVVAEAKILHVTSVSQAVSHQMRGAVERAAEIAQAHGTDLSYDLNLRLSLWSLQEAEACITGFLPRADIVLPSDDEAKLLLGTAEPYKVLSYFERFRPKLVVLKRGARGVILSQNGTRTEIPAQKVKAVDSTGAGDNFAGAFLAGLVAHGDAVRAAHAGVAAAARAVAGYGAT